MMGNSRSKGLRMVGLILLWMWVIAPQALPASLSGVDDWAYQLQGSPTLSLDPITNSFFDLAVIDYSANGTASGEFSASQIQALKASSCSNGKKIVLSYLSIGEAESYRFYWNPAWVDVSGNPLPSAPSWLGPVNPDWAGNYKVRYWEQGWKSIIFGSSTAYLDRIIDAGFDGVYLDIIDAFEYWGPSEIGGTNERRTAPADMVAFVREIAQYARTTRGKTTFLVFPQNGPGIIDASSYPDAQNPQAEADRQKGLYFAVIEGIGAENTYHFGSLGDNNPYSPQTAVMAQLDQFRQAGKVVLAVEYLSPLKSNPNNLVFPDVIDNFYAQARSRSYIPYATVVDLNVLTINPSQLPNAPVAVPLYPVSLVVVVPLTALLAWRIAARRAS